LATIVSGVFTDRNEAESAISDLTQGGVPQGSIHLERLETESLRSIGLTPEQSSRLAEFVKRGATLVRATVADSYIATVRNTMMRRGATTFSIPVQDGSTPVEESDVSVLNPGAFAQSEFMEHYLMEYAPGGVSFDQVRPAYEFGYHFGTEAGYENTWKDWNQVHQEARRRWEQHDPGTWKFYELAIQEGWATAPARLTAATMM
jgi:hypothetical protein